MKTCISTRFDRDNILFDLWIKNSLSYNLEIVIFLDGYIESIYEKIEKINISRKKKITIIDISRFGNIYEINNINFFIDIFNILYKEMGYHNIIYTDPDELLLANNIKKFINLNSNILVSRGFEVCQYIEESEYDIKKSFLEQRNFGFWTDQGHTKESPYNKVFFYSNGEFPKTQGRHAWEINESPTYIKKDFIVLLHIVEISKEIRIENSEFNTLKYKKNHPHHEFRTLAEVDNRLNEWFYPYCLAIPDKIKKIIKKNNL
jgi:hypothetical protein